MLFGREESGVPPGVEVRHAGIWDVSCVSLVSVVYVYVSPPCVGVSIYLSKLGGRRRRLFVLYLNLTKP